MTNQSVDISELKPAFWDVDFETLSWRENQDFIIQRILTHGNMEMIRWLRRTTGDAALVEWIEECDGGKLSPRQLRYWELILNLSESMVNRWIEIRKQTIWEQRGA